MMNELLQNKINELKTAKDYECWYLVKQDTSFVSLCYQVEYLRQFKKNSSGSNLETFIRESVEKFRQEHPNISISNTHRALRVAAFFGLIKMNSRNYNDAEITPTFYEISDRCDGAFEQTESYIDIIQRQIEKMFISSSIDEEHDGVRKNFRLYPVMLLYKVLLELGRATGDFSITINEYRYLVATTKNFEDFLLTLLLIRLLRDEPSVNSILEGYKNKFDNRLIQALKQLPTISVESERIYIPNDKVEEVAYKVYNFEKNPEIFATDNYLEFLASTNSLFELKEFNIFGEKQVDHKKYQRLVNILKQSKNIILHGAPGTGKTYLANKIAMELTGLSKDELRNSDQYEFVQFHPNYDYTDFVEGLRPILNDEGDRDHGEISFERVDGSFKSFCKKAMKNQSKNYVFVIDEINRGEISKIFGELFMVIDPGYRGKEEYAVSTQYSNINGNEKFYIPNNVYVIGTMNDIDRSVDSFDFAMRRRFRFIEITAKETMEMWNGNLEEAKIPEATKRLTALNEEISKIDELNENYHVGPSYFLKLKEIDYDYDVLWADYLKPLLEEYLRGSLDAEESLARLETAYNIEGTEDETA